MSSSPYSRWWFVGVSGSGKSTYARRVASILGLAHHELDATYHQPNWQALPVDEFRSRVRALVADESWAIDGNYREVRSILLSRAEVIVAFDLPRATVMRQIISRTLRRGFRGAELWNGNREQLSNAWRWDERSMIWWSWNTHGPMRERLDWLERLADTSGIAFVRVHSHEQARRRLGALTGVDPSRFLG